MSILDDIADAAEALTKPRQHTEPRYGWDHNRNRIILGHHHTTQPCLLDQLQTLAELGNTGDDGPTARTVASSRPPANLSAVSLLAAISYGSAKRLLDLGIDRRPTAAANINGMVGAAPDCDHDTQLLIRAELRSWTYQAEVIAGWRTPPIELVAPCPALTTPPGEDQRVCGARGTLLLNLDTKTARCTSCGAAWDEQSIGVLVNHVNAYRDASTARAQAARARQRATRMATHAA